MPAFRPGLILRTLYFFVASSNRHSYKPIFAVLTILLTAGLAHPTNRTTKETKQQLFPAQIRTQSIDWKKAPLLSYYLLSKPRYIAPLLPLGKQANNRPELRKSAESNRILCKRRVRRTVLLLPRTGGLPTLTVKLLLIGLSG